jgi:hypothetical protein
MGRSPALLVGDGLEQRACHRVGVEADEDLAHVVDAHHAGGLPSVPTDPHGAEHGIATVVGDVLGGGPLVEHLEAQLHQVQSHLLDGLVLPAPQLARR